MSPQEPWHGKDLDLLHELLPQNPPVSFRTPTPIQSYQATCPRRKEPSTSMILCPRCARFLLNGKPFINAAISARRTSTLHGTTYNTSVKQGNLPWRNGSASGNVAVAEVLVRLMLACSVLPLTLRARRVGVAFRAYSTDPEKASKEDNAKVPRKLSLSLSL